MKSIETRFAEAMNAIKKAGKTKAFDEKATTCTTIEQKLNCAESILKDAGIVARENAPVRKHNGKVDNFTETDPFKNGELITESASEFSPGYVKKSTDPFAKGDKAIADGLLKKGLITEAEHRKLVGAVSPDVAALSEGQRKEYNFARQIGLTESQAISHAKNVQRV